MSGPSDWDELLRRLMHGALVPDDLNPQTEAEIDSLLDRADAQPFSDAEVERILQKARGELPVGTSSLPRDLDDAGFSNSASQPPSARSVARVTQSAGIDLPVAGFARIQAEREEPNSCESGYNRTP